MSSAAKTLELLTHFSTMRPEIGLSQFCRLVGRDKATTYRHLQTLEEAGFVEQNPATKQYRLGPALLQLAQMREQTVPRKESARAALTALADATGETSHVSVLSGNTVFGLLSCESYKHSTRAIVDLETFPLHATASGLSALSFGPAHLMEYACANMTKFTSTTLQSTNALEDVVEETRKAGFAWSNGGYEDEIQGIATPIFGQGGQFAGTIAVASVATRFDEELAKTIQKHLVTASREITRNWGGTVPIALDAIWTRTLSSENQMELST